MRLNALPADFTIVYCPIFFFFSVWMRVCCTP
jgi:hypothetical protein